MGTCAECPKNRRTQSRKSKELKMLLNMTNINNMDVENSHNFPKAQTILMVVRTGQGAQQICGMLQ